MFFACGLGIGGWIQGFGFGVRVPFPVQAIGFSGKGLGFRVLVGKFCNPQCAKNPQSENLSPEPQTRKPKS